MSHITSQESGTRTRKVNLVVHTRHFSIRHCKRVYSFICLTDNEWPYIRIFFMIAIVNYKTI